MGGGRSRGLAVASSPEDQTGPCKGPSGAAGPAPWNRAEAADGAPAGGVSSPGDGEGGGDLGGAVGAGSSSPEPSRKEAEVSLPLKGVESP